MNTAGVYITTAWIEKASELTAVELKVFFGLLAFMSIKDGKAYPSMETLERRVGKKRGTLSRAVASLVDKKYISKTSVISKNGQFSHNVYQICHFDIMQKKLMVDVPDIVEKPMERKSKHDIIRKYKGVSG